MSTPIFFKARFGTVYIHSRFQSRRSKPDTILLPSFFSFPYSSTAGVGKRAWGRGWPNTCNSLRFYFCISSYTFTSGPEFHPTLYQITEQRRRRWQAEVTSKRHWCQSEWLMNWEPPKRGHLCETPRKYDFFCRVVTSILSQRLLHKTTNSRAVFITRIHACWTSKHIQETQYLQIRSLNAFVINKLWTRKMELALEVKKFYRLSLSYTMATKTDQWEWRQIHIPAVSICDL